MSLEIERDLCQLHQLYTDLKEEYGKIQSDIQELAKDCIIAKSTGVAAGVVGTGLMIGGFVAGVAFAPFTFGTSLLASTALGVGGAVTAGAGGLTVAGTNLAKGLKTKGYLEKVQVIEKAVKTAAKRSEDTLIRLMRKVDLLVKEGNSQAESLCYLIYCIKRNVPWEDVEPHVLSVRIKEFVRMETGHPDIEQWSTDRVIGGAVQAGGNTIVGAGVAVTLALADDIAVKLAPGLVAGSVARAAAAGVGAVFGAIFVALDIADLVKEIKDPSKLGEEIEKVKGQYEKSLETVQTVLTLFQKIK